MKKNFFTLLLLSSLTLVGCNKDLNTNNKDSVSDINKITQVNEIKTEINTGSIKNETSQEIGKKTENYTKSSYEDNNNSNTDGVNSKSFEREDIINGFSKDGNFLYYLGKKIEGVDPTSFTRILGSNYYKDINNVYYLKYNGLSPGKLERVEGVDVKTFEIFKIDNIITEYAKNKNNIYYQSNIFNGIDAETFTILGCFTSPGSSIPDCYTKDRNNIYFNASKINGVSINTFEIIKNSEYVKDKNNIYYRGNIVDGADVSTFKVNDYGIEVDKNHIFSQGKKIESSDSKTFIKIGNSFYKDSKQVYTSGLGYNLKVIKGADLKTFESLGDGRAKDKYNEYIYGELIK